MQLLGDWNWWAPAPAGAAARAHRVAGRVKKNGVVYQIYPRSFQDSDGDGVGDLAGIRARLDHLVWLGVDALWLSPIYPSPMADFGYDVSDYTDVDPVFGDLAEFDALARRPTRAASPADGHRALPHVDRAPLVPRAPGLVHLATTSRTTGSRRSAGSAWTRLGDRYYLHSFYPEQPDLDWRNPEVVRAMQDVLRFWLERGADGYRIDAIDRLLKDPRAARRAAGHRAVRPAADARRRPSSRTSTPATRPTPARRSPKIREACGDAFLVGEVYLPSARWQPVPRPLRRGVRVRAAALALGGEPAARGDRGDARASRAPPGCISNHDFGRLATRFGERERPRRGDAAADAARPGVPLPGRRDRAGARARRASRASTAPGRDRHRHPMQWDASPSGGFTTGEPWLPLVDPAQRNVADQRDDPGSMLSLVRELIALRRELGGRLRAARRGRRRARLPPRRPHGRDQHDGRAAARAVAGEPRIQTTPGCCGTACSLPHAGAIAVG